MARQKGTLRMGSNTEPQMNAPLDAREVVNLKADLTDAASFPYYYVGMTVFVKEELKKYTLIGEDTTDITNWKVDEAASGGGDATLENGIEAIVSVGGIEAGRTYAAGEDIESILRDLLYPLSYPTITPPSATLTTVSRTVYEVGTSSVPFSVKVNANRGSITPAYGTSGYRAGEPQDYKISFDNNSNSTGVFADLTIPVQEFPITGSVIFGDGEQPKDSHGNDYDVAYLNPSGDHVQASNSIDIELVYCVWANTTNIAEMTKLDPVSARTKVRTFVFPAQTVENPECFSIPASWTVSKIEVLNDLSGKYEDCASEFTVTDAIYRDAANNDVNYKMYTDNRGYAADTRTIRLTLQ